MKKVGRPRIIESPAEMDRLVEEYVTKCHEQKAPLTLTGMILHLGLSSRRVFDDYGDRPQFAHSVKRSKLLIENGYEVDLRKTGNPAGSIFALRNMGWSDRQEVEFRGVLAQPRHLALAGRAGSATGGRGESDLRPRACLAGRRAAGAALLRPRVPCFIVTS